MTNTDRAAVLRAAAEAGKSNPIAWARSEQAIANDADRRAMEKSAKESVCIACGGDILVTFVAGIWRFRCGTHGYDPDVRSRHEPSLTARYRKAGSLEAAGMTYLAAQSLALSLANNIRNADAAGRTSRANIALLRRLNAELGIVREEGEEMTQALAIIDRSQWGLVPPEDAARFVDLAKLTSNQEMRVVLTEIVKRTGLNPLNGELTVYESRPYVTVDGLRHLALASGLSDGEDEPRPLSATERAEHGFGETDIAFRVVLYRKGISRGFVGTSKANVKDPYRSSAPERAWGPRTAENRAYRHAWRKAFVDLMSGLALNELAEVEDAERFAPRVTDVSPDYEVKPMHEAIGALVDAAPEAALDALIATPEFQAAEKTMLADSPQATDEMVSAIKANATKHKWGTNTLLIHIQAEYNVKALTDLTEAQAAALMDWLDMDGKARTLADVKA